MMAFFLPLLQPEIPGNPTVVFVDLAVAFPPVVELAGGYAQPPDEPPGADLASSPTSAGRNPRSGPARRAATQTPVKSPQDFFLTRCAPPSARPGPHPWSGSSSPRTRSVPASPPPDGWDVPWLEGGSPVLEELFLPPVEDRRLQIQLFTQIRDRLLIHKCRLRMATFSSAV